MKITLFGPVELDGSLYVSRELDHQVLASMERGEYINIRGGRQTGKTSLLLRLRSSLFDRGASSVYIDLSTMGDVVSNQPIWLDLLGSAIQDSIYPIPIEPIPDAPLTIEGFPTFIYEIVRKLGDRLPFVILFDEVTAVPDTIRQPLFALIRAMFNQRTDHTSEPEAKEVLFIFSGSFNPEKMVISKNSPFNIAHDFDTSNFDYTLEQISEMIRTFDINEIEKPIFDLTHGHPYLTNRLVSLILDGKSIDEAKDLILTDDSNLRHLGNKLQGLGSPVLELALKIRDGEQVPCTLGISDYLDHLIVLGLVKSDDNGNAKIRCSLYSAYLDFMKQVNTQRGIGFIP